VPVRWPIDVVTLLRSSLTDVIIRRIFRATFAPSFQAVLLGACLFVAALLVTRAGRADDSSFSGTWGMSPLTETFMVQQWGGSCGPAPVSGTLQPGGVATVRTDGQELVIQPGDSRLRRLRTDQCLDPLPTLARETHSTDGRTWRTRCTTPPSDPRHAVVNSAYFLASSNDAITIAETGQYEFTIQGSRCVANVTREATIRRMQAVATGSAAPTPSAPVVASAPARAAPPTPVPMPVDTMPCASPGDPARLEVRPSRKLLKLGDNYRFRALVVDEAGCPTGTPIQWSIAALHSNDGREIVAQPSVDAAGRLTIPPGATDEQFDVVATAAGHSARAAVEVTSDANYEALLARSGLDPNGERGEPAVTSLATTSIGGSSARAEDGAGRRRTVFISIIAVLVAALGAVAVAGTLRARRAQAVERAAQERHAEKMRQYEREKREREEVHAAQLRAHLESVAQAQKVAAGASAGTSVRGGALFCPSCHREFNDGTAYCPFDANRLVTVAGHEEIAAGPVGGVCPTCQRGFNPGVRVCPHDGDELVPPAMAAARPVATRGKICPTCGGRFDGTAAFCGKDGTMLVLLN
jgi:hypothetical protein